MKKRARDFWRSCRAIACLLLIALWMIDPAAFAALDYGGQVTFNGLPVPGATVTAIQADKQLVAITDQQGKYLFPDLADGAWKLEIEMSGFAAQTQDITVAPDAAGPTVELKLLSLTEITHGAAPVVAQTGSDTGSSPPANGNAAQPSASNSSAAAATPAAPMPNQPSRPAANSANNNQQAPPQPPANEATTGSNSEASSDLQQSAATGLVVNGSVNNGAASAFAQMAAFGNNRRGPGSLYSGNLGLTFDTSAWDARSYTQGSSLFPKPSYNNFTFLGSFGGPIGIPHHLVNQSNFFVGYQHAANDTATTQQGLVPTALERTGDLSQTRNALGPVEVYNPSTNQPYANSVVPVSAQAAALLAEYPMPNATGSGYNYEGSTLASTTTDSMQSRVSKLVKNRNQILGNYAFQRQAGHSTNLFGFTDASKSLGMDGSVSWQRSYRPGGIGYFSTLFRYEYARQSTSENPFFANRTNVSGAAGIQGNDQTPPNWGPPNLSFVSISSLGEAEYARNVNDSQNVHYESLFYHGKHTLQFGGDVVRLRFNTFSQQDARGAFSFTGAATQQTDSSGHGVAGTGSDLADFLVGTPDTAEIAFGNADKYLRGWRYDAYFQDDFRLRAGLTVNAGLRWEYAAPLTEIKNRLVNLDVAPGFGTAAPVLASDPSGSITGDKYPNSLLHSDHLGIEPRLAIAWRPRSNSPLVVRAGYGVYDNTSVYQVIAMQMAQQPPLSKAFDLTNSAANPLTLATAFNSPSGVPTFGVDPNFRVGYVQSWYSSVQQDLPGSLVMTATYSGSKGTRLMQEFLPNTVPYQAPIACPSCPTGFVYLTSNGNSTREAGQIQLRRRLRDGFTATLLYTYAKAIDDASAFSAGAIQGQGAPSVSTVVGSSGSGAVSIAQNWQNLRGERSLSPFDQRNAMTFSMQYTTGEGLRAGALMSGWRGTAFKDWTITSSLTYGSGLPLTPIYETNVAGTGLLQVYRPDSTGAPVKAASGGKFLNSAAFTAPAAGQWGDVGRDSVIGPAQFSLNASFSRVFRLGNRVNAQWETSATNVLNTVRFSTWNMDTISPLFGVPASPNAMRKLQSTFRVRF
jgi:carboxypeptidase family protein